MKLSRTALMASMTLAAAIAIAAALLWWRLRSKPAVVAPPKVVAPPPKVVVAPPKPQPVAPPKPQPVPPRNFPPGIVLPPKPPRPAPKELPSFPVFFPTPILKSNLPPVAVSDKMYRGPPVFSAAAQAAAERAGYASPFMPGAPGSYPVEPIVAARKTIAVPNQTGGKKETFESGTYML